MVTQLRHRTYARGCAFALLCLGTLSLIACAGGDADSAGGSRGEGEPLVLVPKDASTVTAAVAQVAEGGLILLAPGTYAEEVLVDKADVTLRGTDRNRVIIDGEGTRPYGIVATAPGVSIENLTVTSATFYGVLVTGLADENGPIARGADGYEPEGANAFAPLERFTIDHVTATNNGLYGLYAFNANHGVIRESYASGSADSGIYVGQCERCDILVTGNVAEHNAVGFENANASDSVVVAGNRFSHNRVGMTFISNYQEAFAPQRENTIVGNLVSENTSSDSPEHADGAFGLGIGVSGGVLNLFERNRVANNPGAGLVFSNTEDLAALGNQVRATAFEGNGVDLLNISADRAPARANCVDDTAVSQMPEHAIAPCVGTGIAESQAELQNAAPQPSTSNLPEVVVPPGVSFLRVGDPPAQPGLDVVSERPTIVPSAVEMPSLERFGVPEPDFLSERARGAG